MLNACASNFTADTQSTFGLVLTVTPQGEFFLGMAGGSGV